MRVEHRLQVSSVCPVNGGRDLYQMTMRTHRVIKVEDILAAVALRTTEAIFQEELTKQLAKALGCEVETQGWHGEVHTTVICGVTKAKA